MLYYDFEQSPGYWMYISSQAYQRVLNEELAPEGITYRQCQVLGFLALEGPLSQIELADRLHVEPPTLVGILDRMERDRWIARQTCPDDRRKNLIHPTPEAEPVWAKIVAAGQRVRDRATAGLSPAEVEQLRQLLRTVHANLTALEMAEVEP